MTAFYKLQELGYSDSVQMMAMAATSWNGNYCGHNSNSAIYPWGINNPPYYLPSANQLTQYGASAGYYFKNSGYFGNGVLDTSIQLP